MNYHPLFNTREAKDIKGWIVEIGKRVYAKGFAAAGAKVAVLCSSAKVYAEQAVDVARALKDAGVEKVYLAGRLTEVGDDEASAVIDGEVFDGMDVVEFLESTLDQLGVAK